MRITFNVNKDYLGDEAKFLTFIGRLRPAWLLLMNDFDHSLAHKVIDKTDGATRIIVRYADNNEQSFWRNGRPQIVDLVNSWTRLGDKAIVRNVLTEPVWSGDAELRALLDWLIEFMHVAAGNGLKLCVGNFASGAWTPEQLDGGVWDEYLHTLGYYSQQGIHYGGYHEYGAPILPGTNWTPDMFLDPAKAQWWPTREQLHLDARMPDGSLPPNFTVLRSNWMDIRAREIGVPVHDKLLTEFGHDRLPDLERTHYPDSRELNVYSAIEAVYGVPMPYAHLRGQNTYKRYYSAFFPAWSFDEALFRQYRWAEDVYPANTLAMCLFTWSYNDEWANYGFNFAPSEDLQERLIAYANSQRQTTPPVTNGDIPVVDTTRNFPASMQTFANGFMLWRGDTAAISVFYNDGTRTEFTATQYGKFTQALTSYPIPVVLGFGKVWSNFSVVRDKLGAAAAEEVGYTATLTNGASQTLTLADGKRIAFDAVSWRYADAPVTPPDATVKPRTATLTIRYNASDSAEALIQQALSNATVKFS